MVWQILYYFNEPEQVLENLITIVNMQYVIQESCGFWQMYLYAQNNRFPTIWIIENKFVTFIETF